MKLSYRGNECLSLRSGKDNSDVFTSAWHGLMAILPAVNVDTMFDLLPDDVKAAIEAEDSGQDDSQD
jgi:hypothetical protein